MSNIYLFPNYLIYNNGAIYSKKNNKFLKPRYDRNGYMRVDIYNYLKKKQTIKIHQLVAMAYLNHNLNDAYVVDHIDHDKRNNYLHNLQLITDDQNKRKRTNRDLPVGIYRSLNKFKSYITIDKKKFYLGSYDTVREADLVHKNIYNKLMIGVKF